MARGLAGTADWSHLTTWPVYRGNFGVKRARASESQLDQAWPDIILIFDLPF